MGRYDWPSGVTAVDDANARARFNARFVPSPNVRPADGSLPPLPRELTSPRRRRARGVPRAAPTGGAELWLPIGPSAVARGQASGRPRVAGRIRDIAVEPVAGDRVYAASASGGVWYSPDRGRNWHPLAEFAVSPNRETLFPIGNTLSCGALHVKWGAAASGADDEVFVGTGEPGWAGGMPGGQLKGIGILRAVGPAVGNPWAVEPPGLRGETVYRIVDTPQNPGELLAATSSGLWHRPPGAAWTQVAALGASPTGPASTTNHVVDVVVSWVPGRARIWVARYGGLQVAEILNPPAAPAPLNVAGIAFQSVSLNNIHADTRTVLASDRVNDIWVTGKAVATATEPDGPAHLWRVDVSAGLAGIAGTDITNMPPRLFMSAGDQSDYDMALTIHPTESNRLFAAGAAISIDGEFNAALYRCDVAGTVATPMLIGKGVHADCHIVRVGLAPGGGGPFSVWVGCDGGVFVSDADGDAGTFSARNTGLSVLQPGFVANHPTNDGRVVVGMQDNGTCLRIGDTLWDEPFLGDGGGVVYDPQHPNRYLRQYIQGRWHSSDEEFTPPVYRRGATAPKGQKTSEDAESDRARFYMAPGALAYGGTTHLAIGTDRVWYSADWGQNWVTLPKGTDPRSGDNPDLGQDLLEPGTVAPTQYNDTVSSSGGCCSDDYKGTMFTGRNGVTATRWSARSDDDGNHRVRLHVLWDAGLRILTGRRAKNTTGPWTFEIETTEQIRPPADAVEQAAVDDAEPVQFLPALGLSNDVAVHRPEKGAHGSCYLATIGSGGSGPGHEIDTLWWYDGDGHFVPCGLRRQHERSTFEVGGTRIVAPVLSVVVDPDDPDVVFAGTSVGVIKGSFSLADGEPNWFWVNFDNGLPEGAVQDMAIFRHDGVKLLRAALQSRGVWEVDLNEAAEARTYLRVYDTDTRRRPATPLSGPVTHGATQVRWDASPDIVLDTTGKAYPAAGPSEADLHLHEIPRGDPVDHAAQSFDDRTFKVHVLVHHRWFQPATTAQVKVALLRHDGPSEGDVPLGGIWATLLSIAGGDAVPGSLPGDWVKAAAQLVKPITAPVDPRTPRAVTFDVDLTTLESDTRVTFLAVVMSAADQIDADEINKEDASPATTVQELVRYSRHAAARTLRLG